MNTLKEMTEAELRELIASATMELQSRNELAKAKPVAFKELVDIDRYNGGWLKFVNRIDRTQTNGYSIVGGFIECDEPHYWVEGKLYLDCDIEGSRKHPVKKYRLFKYSGGTMNLIATAKDNKSWAVSLWDAIEENLPTKKIETTENKEN